MTPAIATLCKYGRETSDLPSALAAWAQKHGDDK